MPISQDDLFREMGMGYAYVPFTFPTVTVRNNMETSGVHVSNGEVDMLWDSYFKGCNDKGLGPFGGPAGNGKVNADILNYIANETNLGKMKAAAWLNAVFKAVSTQNADPQYLNPRGFKESQVGHVSGNPLESVKTVLKDLGEATGGFLKPVADPVTNVIKYAAIGIVGIAAIYGLYKLTPIFKKKKTGKRR
jgi:hypothetical protein